MRTILVGFLFFFALFYSRAQPNIARQWMDMIEFANQQSHWHDPIQARNFYHAGIVMHDAWAVFEPAANTFFLGQTLDGFSCPFNGIATPADVEAAQEMAMGFAMYRLMLHRYQYSSGVPQIFSGLNSVMTQLGYNPSNTSVDYSDGDPAKLGNYLGQKIIQFALQDGANEVGNYLNIFYQGVNQELFLDPGLPQPDYFSVNPNRWQGVAIFCLIEGNDVCPGYEHLGPEWGNVSPFSYMKMTMYCKCETVFSINSTTTAERLLC